MLTLRGITIAALVLLVAPLAAEAQQPGRPARLGILYGASPAFSPETDPYDRGIVAGLRDHGYVVGQNVVIEFRSVLGNTDERLIRGLAADLIGLGVDVIVTSIEPGVRAVREASGTIPIVMAGASSDPVAAGFIASLARPGGNITGVTLGDLAGKRLELLKEAVPGLRSVAAFHGDPAVPIVAQWLRATESAAQRLDLTFHSVQAPLPGEDPARWEQVFETTAPRGIGAVTIHEAPRFEAQRQLLADLALRRWSCSRVRSGRSTRSTSPPWSSSGSRGRPWSWRPTTSGSAAPLARSGSPSTPCRG